MRAASSRFSTAASSSNTTARPETRGGVGPMWRNYLTVALRALAKNRAYTIINIAGLSLGIAACLLILSYVRYEFSYDRSEEHTSELQSLMRNSYAVFCLKKKKTQ